LSGYPDFVMGMLPVQRAAFFWTACDEILNDALHRRNLSRTKIPIRVTQYSVFGEFL
jgi:hypothetical protein